MLFLISAQKLAITMLFVLLIPIGALIIIAFVQGFRKARSRKNVNSDEIDEVQKEIFVNAFGGNDNICSVTSERTKLIVTVNDYEKVQGEKLKELGASNVLITGNCIKCTFGDRTNAILNLLTVKNEVEKK